MHGRTPQEELVCPLWLIKDLMQRCIDDQQKVSQQGGQPKLALQSSIHAWLCRVFSWILGWVRSNLTVLYWAMQLLQQHKKSNSSSIKKMNCVQWFFFLLLNWEPAIHHQHLLSQLAAQEDFGHALFRKKVMFIINSDNQITRDESAGEWAKLNWTFAVIWNRHVGGKCKQAYLLTLSTVSSKTRWFHVNSWLAWCWVGYAFQSPQNA